MADTISLGDVSSKDTGTGSKLKTGGRKMQTTSKDTTKSGY